MWNQKKKKSWCLLHSRHSDCCRDPAPIQYPGHWKDQLVHSWSTTQSKQTKNPTGSNLFPVNIWVISKYSSTPGCLWTIHKQAASAKISQANCSLPIFCHFPVTEMCVIRKPTVLKLAFYPLHSKKLCVRSGTVEFMGKDNLKTLLRHLLIKIFTAFHPMVPKPSEHHYFHFSSRKNKAKGENAQSISDAFLSTEGALWSSSLQGSINGMINCIFITADISVAFITEGTE